MKQRFSILAFLLFLSSMIHAHPGHGGADHDPSEGYTITHYFTEPFHLAIMALIIIVACYVSAKMYKKSKRKDKKATSDNRAFINEHL